MIIAENIEPGNDADFGLWSYADSLIRITHAGVGFQLRLELITNDEELMTLINELEQMRLPLAYERTPLTVKEIGYCIRFMADKDDYYDRD